MGKVIAGMSVSLDGYINDQNGSVEKLYSDFNELHNVSSFKEMIENTGAAIMGKRVYEMADPFEWANDEYEFQTPIFVLTHTPPEKFPKGNGRLTFTFVTDGIESAVSQAKKAAGGRDVQVIGGASIFQQCLNARLCDEISLDIISELLGNGQKLFEHINFNKVKLQRTKVEETTQIRTSMTFRLT